MTAARNEVEFTNLPWVEKYRPSSLDDLVSHKEIVKTFEKKLTYFGFRDSIITFAQTKSLHVDRSAKTNLKLVILDEADAMTKDAQNALRSYLIFLGFRNIFLYQTKLKILISECTRFRFAPLEQNLIIPRIDHVIAKENLTVTECGKRALLSLSGGDMRRVLNVLQSVSMAFPIIDETSVYKCVGQPTPKQMEDILKILLNDTFENCCRSEFSSVYCKLYISTLFIKFILLSDMQIEYCLKENEICLQVEAMVQINSKLWDTIQGSSKKIIYNILLSSCRHPSNVSCIIRISWAWITFDRNIFRGTTSRHGNKFTRTTTTAISVMTYTSLKFRYLFILCFKPVFFINANFKLLRTHNLCQSLKAVSERKHPSPGQDPDLLLDYCQRLMDKLVEIRLRIEKKVPNKRLTADEYIMKMCDQSAYIDNTPLKLKEKHRIFEENRNLLVSINNDLKMLDWMASVSDPGQLKKVDKMASSLRE
uniref:Replication factor C subunit 3 n=1 Tax=Heterorhabditis bacteriophora TaxID=37862 RepID=A0A1I7WKJ2_HETBA